MKSKTFPTSNSTKLFLIGCTGIALAACDLTTSREAVQARIGQSLDDVIADWGFPTGEREVLGKKLIYWEESEVSYENVPKVGLKLPIGDNGSVSAEIPLGEAQELRCERTVEIDRSSTIVSAAVEGNNCPYYAPRSWL